MEVARELRLEMTESRQLDLASSRFWRKKTAPSGALALRGAFKPGLVESHLRDAAAGNRADADADARMLRLDSSWSSGARAKINGDRIIADYQSAWRLMQASIHLPPFLLVIIVSCGVGDGGLFSALIG